MHLSLSAVRQDQKLILANLLELYLHDLSESLPLSVDQESGRFGYAYLDTYWTETRRQAYFIKVGGKIAGFVMVNDHLLVLKQGRAIAEFFVMRAYRRRGLGQKALNQLFAQCGGAWEVAVHSNNLGALKFWRESLLQISSTCEESALEDHGLRKQVFTLFVDR